MKKMKTFLALTLCASVSFAVNAHRVWIKPSSTVLSGEAPWVTFDAAVSNMLFVPDHVAYRLAGIHAMSPNGTPVELQNASQGKYRSTFDLELTSEGTYKVFSASGGLRARWEDSEGKRKMWPGRGQTAKDSDFTNAVPIDAKNLNVSRSYHRVETFVTSGNPSKEVFKLSGQGLELTPDTHPNDLYAGEQARFQLFFNGAPAANSSVEIVAGAMRYRNQQDEMSLRTDDKGFFTVTWPHAGTYMLEAEYQDEQATAPATSRRGTYVAILEVLPL